MGGRLDFAWNAATGEATHFTSKEKKYQGASNFRIHSKQQHGANVYACELKLPSLRPGTCTAKVGDRLPKWMPCTEWCSTEAHAAHTHSHCSGKMYFNFINAGATYTHISHLT